jgi:murein DD-endopeptidase MepM/ murein hydrolase activator NlpD
MKIDISTIPVSDVLEDGWQHRPRLMVDLTKNSALWQSVQQGVPFDVLIKEQMRVINAEVSWGRYNENRFIYQDTEHFAERQQNTLHIGVDLGVPHGIIVQSPLDAIVHSVKNNQQVGDYGPTVILQHQINDRIFYTLYGHLSTQDLTPLYKGKKIRSGEGFAHIGTTEENGGWPSHLHFQIIHDLQGRIGDYAGVVNPNESEFYLSNCPDPNTLLRVNLSA